jgi:midasin
LKGFCTPAEFNDEAENEGATKFEDIEAGGLGDGEGAKDVSEQIESEDQVSYLKYMVTRNLIFLCFQA